MSSFEFYMGITGFVLIYWSILYFLFHRFRKNNSKPVYKLVSYWLTSIFSTISIYLVGLGIFLNTMFEATDYTDSTIGYGTEIIAGEDDGLMYTDWIKIYDNHTFHILSYQIESNGKYSMKNDTIELLHNKNYEGSLLPDFYVIKGRSLFGYRRIGNKIDSTMFHYFGLYIYTEKTTP